MSVQNSGERTILSVLVLSQFSNIIERKEGKREGREGGREEELLPYTITKTILGRLEGETIKRKLHDLGEAKIS